MDSGFEHISRAVFLVASSTLVWGCLGFLILMHMVLSSNPPSVANGNITLGHSEVRIAVGVLFLFLP